MTDQKPFGSYNLAAEMAVTVGEDPRPFLTADEISLQAAKNGMTVEEWNAAFDDKLKGFTKWPF